MISTPPRQFGHYCPELGAHVDPEQGGDGAGQEGAEHGDVPHVQHPDGQGGHAVDSHGDEEHKRARVILNQAEMLYLPIFCSNMSSRSAILRLSVPLFQVGSSLSMWSSQSSTSSVHVFKYLS